MELSKLNHIQRYMTNFELDYIKFERLPQRHQISIIFKSSMKEVFETLETAGVDMSTSPSMIEPIVNLVFSNIFRHKIGPN